MSEPSCSDTNLDAPHCVHRDSIIKRKSVRTSVRVKCWGKHHRKIFPTFCQSGDQKANARRLPTNQRPQEIRHYIRMFEYNNYMPDSLRQFKAEIFQALAHPTRIAILDQLRNGELTAGSFVELLGLEQANLSQHLAVLRARQIVSTRKVGNQVFYSVRDTLIFKILDLMRRYFHKQVGESVALLEEMERAEEHGR
jgi:DNA-binding transcriptional ArsR family regulator